MDQSQHDPDFERWPPPALVSSGPSMPGWITTLWRGTLGRCPRCGRTPIFEGYLKVHAACAYCGAPLGQMPADDTPPYIAIIVVLHIVTLFVVIAVHRSFLPGPLLAVFLLGMLAGICMVALRLAKGAVIGILLKLGLKREPLRG